MGAASEGSNKRRKTNDDSDSDDDSDDEEVGGKAGDLAQIIDKNFFQTDAASEGMGQGGCRRFLCSMAYAYREVWLYDDV